MLTRSHEPPPPKSLVGELNQRSREVFRRIVESYVETGEPVGSRTLSRRLDVQLSPATIRNIMADLQDAGLLHAPHTSAGRLPTEAGLRLFVHGLLEVGALTQDEKSNIEIQCNAAGRSLAHVLEEATTMLSGLGHCAGMVLAPKTDEAVKHIEFVDLGPGRTLAVMISQSGVVENRLMETPLGLPPSALAQAGNYLNARMQGRTFGEARVIIENELEDQRAALDELTARVVETGLATWSSDDTGGYLIVRGQAHLLDDVSATSDLEKIRGLFEALETKEAAVRLLDAAQTGDGVQIFIGADNQLFGIAGCSMVIAPYLNSRRQIVGAIGVIGPTRINYARIIPMVDYTAKVIGRLLG